MNPEQSRSSNPHSQITGLILAGGQGRRMGRVDKGLQLLQGRRMVDHVYQRLSPQVAGIVISANQNQDAYRSFGVRVVSDIVSATPGDDRGAGPLAGLHAGLSVSKRPLLLSVWNVGCILNLGHICKSLLNKHWRGVRFYSPDINTYFSCV